MNETKSLDPGRRRDPPGLDTATNEVSTMHEAAIAMNVLEESLAVATAHGAGRISRIELELGALEQVVPDALRTAFHACAEGSAAEGAELVLEETGARARCRPCGIEFEPRLDEPDFTCPQCHRADIEILEGEHIILTSVECELSEESPSS